MVHLQVGGYFLDERAYFLRMVLNVHGGIAGKRARGGKVQRVMNHPLPEPDKEADRQISETVARWTLIGDAARASLETDLL